MKHAITVLLFTSALTAPVGALQQQTWWGGSPYVSSRDGPLESGGAGFVRETFEDGRFDLPGVTASPGQVMPPGPETDSVDGDDGVLDGSGNGGSSFRVESGLEGLTLSFDPAVLGGLPTSVGIVWTDGAPSSEVFLETFDAQGRPSGGVGSSPNGDGDFLGGTAEDRFLGVQGDLLVGMLRLWTDPVGGRDVPMEIDHVQIGGISAWYDLGDGLAGTFGVPALRATGALVPDGTVLLQVEALPTGAPGVLVFGFDRVDLPLKGGTLVPSADVIIPGVVGNSNGNWQGAFRWPAGLAELTPVYLQAWVPDDGAPAGMSASNALQVGGVP